MMRVTRSGLSGLPGCVLFGASMLVTASAGAADAPIDEAPVDDGAWMSELGQTTFPDPAALCRAYVERARMALAEEAKSQVAPLDARVPRCRAEPRPVPFQPSGPWRSLRVVHVDDGLGTGARLLVETRDGFSLSPLAWDVDDARDPGCPSIIRYGAIERVAVENGALVVILLGERTTHVEPTDADDPGYRSEQLRSAWFARPARGAVRFQLFEDEGPSALGARVQPHWAPERQVSWETLPWSGPAAFRIDAGGVPRIERP